MSGLADLGQYIDTSSKKPRPNEDPNWFADAGVLIDGHLVTIRFRALSAEDWARRTFDSTPRPGVDKDNSFGFNLPAVCEAVAKVSGYVTEGDVEELIPADMWEKLWPLLSAPDRNAILDAVFLVNQWVPQAATLEAKKAHLLTLAKSGDSPASLESPLGASEDGSPEKSSTSKGTSGEGSPDSSSPVKPSGTTRRSRPSSPRVKKS